MMYKAIFSLGVFCLFLLSSMVKAIESSGPSTVELIHRSPHARPSVAYQWLQLLLEASGRDVDRYGARPTVLSRTMRIVLTAMYEAWAVYDDKAVGTVLDRGLRRPKSERTLKNKEKAVAYAAYLALLDVYPEDKEWIQGQMRKMGHDPANVSTNRNTPEGIGISAAQAIIKDHHHDGANQLGDEEGSDGRPYSDYTFYRPKNSPKHIVDPLTWMPIPFVKANGEMFSPAFLTPHWYRVRPFALKTSHQFRPPPPPLFGSKELIQEVEEAIKVNAELTLEQKAVVEFMRDGPRSTGQSGHWLQFAQDVSRRDNYQLDQDIKLFFAVANIVYDAFIACWETKRFYDTSRPYWWVRIMNKGKKIRGWGGPGKGMVTLPAEEWHPYSPANFVSPPFPGYVSGHATVSAAAAKILELFTGSPQFGAISVLQAGELTEAEYSPERMQAIDGKPAKAISQSKEVRLSLPTFQAVAEMAAISRLWGGYHIRSDNEKGLEMGREIAMYSWPIYQAYFEGRAVKRERKGKKDSMLVSQ